MNNREIKPPEGVPPCPQLLDDYGRVAWDQLVAILHPLGLLTTADGMELACLADAWSELWHATDELKANGRTVPRGENGLANHPAWTRKNSAWTAIQKMSGDFGLSPSARARIKMPGVEGPVDELAKYVS